MYDLAPDIPDVMGLRALMPSVAIVNVMSVPDSRCIRVVTRDDHVNIEFHDILLHDMGEEGLPFVAVSELDYLRRIWPKWGVTGRLMDASFVYMHAIWQQFMPIILPVVDKHGQHHVASSVEMFNHAVRLRVVRCSSSLCIPEGNTTIS